MVATAALARPTTRRGLYVGLAAVAIAIAAVGFWPTYFGPFLAGTVDKTPIVHLHAAVYVGWLAIFLTQTVLAATGRIASHMKLGRIAIGYGVLVIAVGLLTAFARFALRVRAGEAAGEAQLLGPLLDMLVFAPAFAAAVYYRRQPELHKRLMVVATTALLIAAVGRMPFLGEPPNQLLFHSIWVAPILLAMAHDFWGQRKVHPSTYSASSCSCSRGPSSAGRRVSRRHGRT